MAIALMTPFLVKTNSPGFMPAAWAKSDKCEVFQNQIIQTRFYNKREFIYVHPMQTEVSLAEMIHEAMDEQIVLEDNYMCDGPSTTVKATVNKDGQDHEVILYSTGGCGSPKKVRQGPVSYALMDIASTFCPTTH